MPKGDAVLVQPWLKTSTILGAKDWKKNTFAAQVQNNSKVVKWNENLPPAEYTFKVEKIKTSNFSIQPTSKPNPNMLFSLKNDQDMYIKTKLPER